MAFVKAKIVLKSAAIGTGVKASLKKTNKSAASLSLSISEAVGKDLSLSDGDKIEIMVGDGEHHGLLRIRKNNSVGQTEIKRRVSAKGAWFSLRLGHQEMFIDRSEPSCWCQWEKVEDGWMEIVLPRWSDETAPSKRAATASQSKSAVVQPIKRGTSVTASLMGDPPAGRAALASKG